jgi:hypothetical protein
VGAAQGTSDLTPWLAVPAALAVLRAVGVQRAADHNVALAQAAARMLMQVRRGESRRRMQCTLLLVLHMQ